jgi:hypothetical protein
VSLHDPVVMKHQVNLLRDEITISHHVSLCDPPLGLDCGGATFMFVGLQFVVCPLPGASFLLCGPLTLGKRSLSFTLLLSGLAQPVRTSLGSQMMLHGLQCAGDLLWCKGNHVSDYTDTYLFIVKMFYEALTTSCRVLTMEGR